MTSSELLTTDDRAIIESLYHNARLAAESIYGDKVFARGLIEISSFCRNNCLYCGLRRDNRMAVRYRLTEDEILCAVRDGYALGLRSFVLQGGEDGHFTDALLCSVVKNIKREHPDVAVTLSVGERSFESYRRLKASGTDRYLLRHEAADAQLYSSLHPANMSQRNRTECLRNLQSLGFQTGCGFMVGAPGCSIEGYLKDLKFIEQLQPAMVGIGPFIPADNTPFSSAPQGSTELTLRLLAILRTANPHLLLPATTALDTLLEDGLEQGIMAGANVIMPNITPMHVRGKYTIYNNKRITGSDAAESLETTRLRLQKINRTLSLTRGDYI